MALADIKRVIRINSKYVAKESQAIPRIAIVDTVSELEHGKTEVTYHYGTERKSKWFLTAEEFMAKFKC